MHVSTNMSEMSQIMNIFHYEILQDLCKL